MSGGGGSTYNPVQGRRDTATGAESSRVTNTATTVKQQAVAKLLTPGRDALMAGGGNMPSEAQAVLQDQLTSNDVLKEQQAAQKALDDEKKLRAEQMRLTMSTMSRSSNVGHGY